MEKIEKRKAESKNSLYGIVTQLEEFFKNSIKELKSYEELTDAEKKIITKELFNYYKQ